MEANVISCTTWVKKGVAAAIPERVKLILIIFIGLILIIFIGYTIKNIIYSLRFLG